MTRLTTDLIEEVPFALGCRDDDLMAKAGLSLKGLALRAIGATDEDLDLRSVHAAAVPVTSGKGIIRTFSDSVCAITQHMGMDSIVTRKPDVAGLAEAVAGGADIVFMADDEEFIALNLRSGGYVDNVRSTALGYCTALDAAMGGISGREVLVIGAGRVGSYAIGLLRARGAKVTLLEKDMNRAIWAKEHFGVSLVHNAETGLRQAKAILNASPAVIPGGSISHGVVISSPGVPYGFDAEAERRAKVIIHDPLQIGVAVMAAWSASLSHPAIPCTMAVGEAVEALE